VLWQSSVDNFNANIVNIATTSNQLTVNNLTQTTQYRAQVKSGVCDAAFSTVATVTVNTTLPVQNTSVRAVREGEAVRIQFTAYDQQNTQHFVIEHSTDGQTFSSIHSLQPEGIANLSHTYSWIHSNPGTGSNYYRIREVYKSGLVEFTRIVRLDVDRNGNTLVVYPNPVKGGMVYLQHADLAPGRYRIQVINAIGQPVSTVSVSHVGAAFTQGVSLPQHLAKGLYKIELSADSGKRFIGTFSVH